MLAHKLFHLILSPKSPSLLFHHHSQLLSFTSSEFLPIIPQCDYPYKSLNLKIYRNNQLIALLYGFLCPQRPWCQFCSRTWHSRSSIAGPADSQPPHPHPLEWAHRLTSPGPGLPWAFPFTVTARQSRPVLCDHQHLPFLPEIVPDVTHHSRGHEVTQQLVPPSLLHSPHSPRIFVPFSGGNISPEGQKVGLGEGGGKVEKKKILLFLL